MESNQHRERIGSPIPVTVLLAFTFVSMTNNDKGRGGERFEVGWALTFAGVVLADVLVNLVFEVIFAVLSICSHLSLCLLAITALGDAHCPGNMVVAFCQLDELPGVLTWMHPFPFIFSTIFMPAEIGHELGMHERERAAHLVS